jgi:hypothetical protein
VPYAKCPSCQVEFYSAAPAILSDLCASCGASLAAAPEKGPLEQSPPLRPRRSFLGRTADPAALLDLQTQIATRIRRGASMDEVEQEILATCSLDKSQLPALRSYALTRLQAGRDDDGRDLMTAS